MERKVLGKIKSAEFGKISDYPMYMGLLLEFTFDGNCHVGDGGMFTINMSKDCKWSSETIADGSEDRRIAIEEQADAVYKLLNDAKARTVSQLKGKPVEITVENRTFKDFRILTEVL